MISIQDVGKQILSGCPSTFYVMVGTEYGVKCRYIQSLTNHYGTVVEATSVTDILNMMKTKRIIPLQPALYVVRYDEAFISTINDTTQSMIQNTNIIGTIICIYEQPKHASKLSKYLPDFTVSVDAVNSQFVAKYLHSEFPALPDRFIDLAVSSSLNYTHAQNMCRGLALVDVQSLYSMSDGDIAKLFGRVNNSTEDQIKAGIASRNFAYLIKVIEAYPDDVDRILYAILSTMIELDKISANSYIQSPIREYVSRWTPPDIYYMFMHTYQELERVRSTSSYDAMNSVIYLIGLLSFPNIPALEAMV